MTLLPACELENNSTMSLPVLEETLKKSGFEVPSAELLQHEFKTYAWRIEAVKPVE